MYNTSFCGVFVYWSLYFVCTKCIKATIRIASFVLFESIAKPVFNITGRNLHWEMIFNK